MESPSTWEDIRDGWSDAWRGKLASAKAQWAVQVQENPENFRQFVERMMHDLATARANLIFMRAVLGSNPGVAHRPVWEQNIAAMEQQYWNLAAGLMIGHRADDRVSGDDEVGIAPYIVAGGIAVSVIGVIFAVATWEYAKTLRDETQLQREELAIRDRRTPAGEPLPDSTLRPRSDDKGIGMLGWGVIGVLGLTAAAITVPIFLRPARGS